MDGSLIMHGNGKTYGGLSPLASPTAEVYYRGYWHDLYVTSHRLKIDPEKGSVSLVGFQDGKYVYHFSKRHIEPYSLTSKTPFVLAPTGALELPSLLQTPNLTLYRRQG